jgi:hypothetical protein
MAPIDAVKELRETLPPIVARAELGRLTGGLVNSRTMANRDCQGTGPAGRFMVGQRVAYPRDAFVDWLAARIGEPRVKTRPENA